MNIHLILSDKIQEFAVFKLLEDRNYQVSCTQSGTSDSGNFLSNEGSGILISEVEYLSGLTRTDVENLCNEHPRMILMGKMNHLYGVFEFINGIVAAFVCERDNIDSFFKAIKEVQNRQIYLSREVKAFLKRSSIERQEGLFEKELDRPFTLTELKIMNEIGAGVKSGKIAEKLYISMNTVNNHRKNIANKLSFVKELSVVKFCVENQSSIKTLIGINTHKEWLKGII